MPPRLPTANWAELLPVPGNGATAGKPGPPTVGAFGAGNITYDLAIGCAEDQILAAKHGDNAIKNALAKKVNGLNFDPAHWRVVLMVLGGDAANPATDLPFLAKINVRKQLDEIKNMRFQIAIAVA